MTLSASDVQSFSSTEMLKRSWQKSMPQTVTAKSVVQAPNSVENKNINVCGYTKLGTEILVILYDSFYPLPIVSS